MASTEEASTAWAEPDYDDTKKTADVEAQDPVVEAWDNPDKAEESNASWEKVDESKNSAKPTVTDMPTRPPPESRPEGWRNINVKVKKTWLHRAFISLVWLSVAIHVSMMVAQLIGVYFYWMTSIQGIMRCYVIAFCITGVLVELQYTKFLRDSVILRVWITRGLFYCLIGVLALDEQDTENDGKHLDVKARDGLLFFIEFMGYAEVALGLLYYAMGCLCLQQVKHKVYANFDRRCAEINAAQKGVKYQPPVAKPIT